MTSVLKISAVKCRLQIDYEYYTKKLEVQSTNGDWQEMCLDEIDNQTVLAVCRNMGYAWGLLVYFI